jgi:hypothetical protein
LAHNYLLPPAARSRLNTVCRCAQTGAGSCIIWAGTKGSRILLTLETPELTAMLQVVLQAAGMQVRVLPWNAQYLQPGDAWCREVEAYDPDWCFLTSALHLEPLSYWGRVCWEQDLRWQLKNFRWSVLPETGMLQRWFHKKTRHWRVFY